MARSPAFRTAMILESTRLICPAPIPTVFVFCANKIAFDLTCLHAFQLKNKDLISFSVGFLRVATCRSFSDKSWESSPCTKIPLVMCLKCKADLSCSNSPVARILLVFTRESCFNASLVKSGAIIASIFIPDLASSRSKLAVFKSTSLLNPTMLPNADTRSQSSASRNA